MYDVIVVGARCAGAPTAMLFARAGYRVLLLDRVRFPCDTLSTLYIHQPAVATLARWGVLDAVAATGCPPLDRAAYEMGGVRLEGCASGVDGHRAAYAPRRYLLDAVLADAATAAGAELRAGCAVRDLIVDDGRVTGVYCTTPQGRTVAEHARLVVGADGMRSVVARLAGAREELGDPRKTCAYYTFWRGLRVSFELHESDEGWVSAVPTNDDAVLVAAYFPQSEFDAVRRDAWGAYHRNVRATAPQLSEQLADAERVERLRGTGDQQNFFRTAGGPGWVLVGDAGHHKDSLTARGISDAFLQAELLVERVGDRLHDEEHLRSALAQFGRERDRRLMDGYLATLAVAEGAQGEGRGQRVALLSAIQGDAELTTLYFDVFAGIRSTDELYAAVQPPAAQPLGAR